MYNTILFLLDKNLFSEHNKCKKKTNNLCMQSGTYKLLYELLNNVKLKM